MSKNVENCFLRLFKNLRVSGGIRTSERFKIDDTLQEQEM